MDVDGSTIAITGAAQGLGAEMARHLGSQGAGLALIDIDAGRLDALAGELGLPADRVRTYECNVADETQTEATYDRIAGDFGALDVSIANAGILRDGLLIKSRDGQLSGKLSLTDWQAVIDVNLTGVFLCGREAAAQMAKLGRPGLIINISSISRHGNFGQTNYSAAKAGVAAMTVVWAKELARTRIRCNAIAPGFVATEILSSMKPEVLEKVTAGIPTGRLGAPAEVAATARFLIENDYVNGRIIEVDGGLRI